MKNGRIKKTVILFLILTISLGLFSSCKNLSRLEYNKDSNTYVDSKNNVSYTYAPGCYEPQSIGEEYCKIDDTVLLQIGNLDPKMWLCEQNTETVFYNTEIELPSFEQMTVTKILLCYEDAQTFEFRTLTDSAEIKEIVDVYRDGEAGAGFATEPQTRISLKFVFEECPDIYYSILYVADGNGKAYFTNRYENKIVTADGLLDKYLENASTDTAGDSATE